MGNYPPSTWLKDARWPVTTMADDVNSSAGKAFGLTRYPYFVFVDAAGTVRSRVAGEQTVDSLRRGRSGHAVVAVALRERSLGPRPTGECETPATLAAHACRG
jgi:hypothetical protein